MSGRIYLPRNNRRANHWFRPSCRTSPLISRLHSLPPNFIRGPLINKVKLRPGAKDTCTQTARTHYLRGCSPTSFPLHLSWKMMHIGVLPCRLPGRLAWNHSVGAQVPRGVRMGAGCTRPRLLLWRRLLRRCRVSRSGLVTCWCLHHHPQSIVHWLFLTS